MRLLLLVVFFGLASCHPKAPDPKVSDPVVVPLAPEPRAPTRDLYPNLPRAKTMQTEGEFYPPKPARDFCARHKEFEAC